MFEKECVPFAPSLIESMRSLGYTFQSAIADLIDNSVSAKSTKIKIISEPGPSPSLYIIDNGCGMSPEKLYEAMRYGSDPLAERDKEDLGRFGLGLKSASLSQCRKLIVVSKKSGEITGYSWDLDYVIEKGSWVLKGFSQEEILKCNYIEELINLESGTYICLTDFDRIKESTGNLTETFNKYLNYTVDHLSLVFHRFIDEGLIIDVNGYIIPAKDPFLSYHKSTQVKRESHIYINDEKITLKPFILPHLSKLNQDDLDKLGGKEKLKNEQGFYVYRNKRLIIWGTWFRLERKDELSKLARVMVDIPNSLDYMWAIDIKKSTATLPDIIKKNMYNAIYESVLASESVHTYRGRKENKDKDIDYVWERTKSRNGYVYTINRDIPQIKLLEETMDSKQLKFLDSILNLFEETFPVNALYVDAAKGIIDDKDEKEIESLWNEIQTQIEFVKENGLNVLDYYKLFLKVEPYCNYGEIKEKIIKEMKEYE